MIYPDPDDPDLAAKLAALGLIPDAKIGGSPYAPGVREKLQQDNRERMERLAEKIANDAHTAPPSDDGNGPVNQLLGPGWSVGDGLTSGESVVEPPVLQGDGAVSDRIAERGLLWEGEIPGVSRLCMKPWGREEIGVFPSRDSVQLLYVASDLEVHLARRLAALERDHEAQVKAAYFEGSQCPVRDINLAWKHSLARARLEGAK